MKYLLLLSIILLESLSAYSQCVSIELSVQWNREINPITLNEKECIPYLNITYRNNSDYPLYFLKVSQGENGFPVFLRLPIPRSKNVTVWKGYYLSSNYTIELSGLSHYLSGSWDALPDTVDRDSEIEEPFINSILEEVYGSINKKKEYSGIEKKMTILHYDSDINPDKILTMYKEKFIFLKPGEVFNDSYNLIGLLFIKGNYTFKVRIDSLKRFVYTESLWDNEKSMYTYPEVPLPEKVGEYNLYAGDFKSNTITINFD